MGWSRSISVVPLRKTLPALPSVSDFVGTEVLSPTRKALTNRAELGDWLRADPWPLPATDDREGYHGSCHLEYWLSGLEDYLLVKAQALLLGVPFGENVALLELGCASGRVLRHFLAHEKGLRLLGSDINRNHIEWILAHLPPSLTVFQNTVLPHLPLRDSSLDLIVAFSVFTHIDDFELAWVLELSRVLKPGGLALVSIHSERTWNGLEESTPLFQGLKAVEKFLETGPIHLDLFRAPMPDDRVVFRSRAQVYNINIFHSDAYVRREWGRILEVRDILPGAHGYQDLVLLINGK
jgi:SAM-dependent methyltransferase